jgi:hypothetical protein
MTTAEQIGSKYGQSTDDFATAQGNTLTDIVLRWCNGGIGAMRTKIQKNVRTGGASILAQSMATTPSKITASKVSIDIVADKDAYYWKFVDKGVRGVKKNKAGNSPYKFKTIGAGKNMVDSFKKYIAKTGSKSMSGKKLTSKNKKKQASAIDKEAKAMAVATKIGGIKPVNFVREATNKKRVDQLVNEVAKGLGATIKVSIKRVANEYNSK